jgi:hypothetical protein
MSFEGGITMPIKEVVEFYSSTERRFPPDGGEAGQLWNLLWLLPSSCAAFQIFVYVRGVTSILVCVHGPLLSVRTCKHAPTLV